MPRVSRTHGKELLYSNSSEVKMICSEKMCRMCYKVTTGTLMLKPHVKQSEQNHFPKVRVEHKLSKVFMYIILKAHSN